MRIGEAGDAAARNFLEQGLARRKFVAQRAFVEIGEARVGCTVGTYRDSGQRGQLPQFGRSQIVAGRLVHKAGADKYRKRNAVRLQHGSCAIKVVAISIVECYRDTQGRGRGQSLLQTHQRSVIVFDQRRYLLREEFRRYAVNA